MNSSPYCYYSSIISANHKGRPYGRQVQGAMKRALSIAYLRGTMVSLFVGTVKYQIRSTNTIAPGAYRRDDLCRSSRDASSGLLARQLLSLALHKAGTGGNEFADDDI